MNSANMNKNRKFLKPYVLEPRMVHLWIDCRLSVRRYVSTIYVGSIVRLYNKKYGTDAQLQTIHWGIKDGLFVTFHDKQKSDLVKLEYDTWVVENCCVKPGSFLLYKWYGTNDIKDKSRNMTINELKQINSKVLTKNMLMDFKL